MLHPPTAFDFLLSFPRFLDTLDRDLILISKEDWAMILDSSHEACGSPRLLAYLVLSLKWIERHHNASSVSTPHVSILLTIWELILGYHLYFKLWYLTKSSELVAGNSRNTSLTQTQLYQRLNR